jgi:hypothetical protein
MAMLKFQVPASYIISGASGSGKTRWAYELFKKDLELRNSSGEGIFEKPFDRVIISYKQFQPIYQNFVSLFPPGTVQLSSGMPWDEIESLDGSNGQVACLIDDQMSTLGET